MNAERYAVIEVGCTECNDTCMPVTKLVTADFREASDLARDISKSLGRPGDGFVIRLSDGGIAARGDRDETGDIWIENEEVTE